MSEQAIIDAETAVKCFIRTSVLLRKSYEELLSEWSPDAPPVTIVFSTFGRILCSMMPNSKLSEIAKICRIIEDLLLQGNETVKNAVATGMLEAVLAEASAGKFDFSSVTCFLGPESKAYCRAWDAFTGNKTEGLFE